MEAEAVRRSPQLDISGPEGVSGRGGVEREIDRGEGEEACSERGERQPPPRPHAVRRESRAEDGADGQNLDRPAEERDAENQTGPHQETRAPGLVPARIAIQKPAYRGQRRDVAHEARAHEEEEGREYEQKERDARRRLVVRAPREAVEERGRGEAERDRHEPRNSQQDPD